MRDKFANLRQKSSHLVGEGCLEYHSASIEKIRSPKESERDRTHFVSTKKLVHCKNEMSHFLLNSSEKATAVLPSQRRLFA